MKIIQYQYYKKISIKLNIIDPIDIVPIVEKVEILCNFCNIFFESDIELFNHYENHQCKCSPKNYLKINKVLNNKNKFGYKKYTLPSGKIINYQGYENYALDELLILFNENDIQNERFKIPIIKYTFKNKEYNYYPDIYIESENKIIEVKSDWTYKNNIIKNTIKALATKKL